MTDFVQRIKDLPQKKLVVLAAQLQERLERAEAATAPVTDERAPIAVVGIGCRFPGGIDSPESYWDLLIEGRDAISETPSNRWDVDEFYDPDFQTAGKMATRWGGYLDDVDHFDARLFGISPREAVGMDPQQRLLLEVTWEALERAAIAPASLSRTPTGVYIGASSTDYLALQMRRGLEAIDGYLASGSALSVSAGRIAYTLGLNGPAITTDTACSSSLVAVTLAVQALRRGECDAAIAGGTNTILSPITTIALSKSQMMAPDGRCKTFSANADGFVRAEGCAALVLKRLDDAVRDGDPIAGVIRGAALNQDGRSNGLTAPNGPAQQAVINAALADAGVVGPDIGYVEAHGTGTKLGDPIEVQALAATLGRDRPAPLRIGSVKTNFGHAESASGVAGLIKAMLVLQHGVIPPHLHFDEPSNEIAWDRMAIEVPTVPTPWTGDGPRLAGVSSFGFSGTNAHLICAAPPERSVTPAKRPARDVEVVCLSAQSPGALREMAAAHAEHLDRADVELGALARTLNTARDVFPHRDAYIVGTTAEVREALAARANASTTRQVISGHFGSSRSVRPVMLFTGQGSQYTSMGRELFASEPVFAGVIDQCDVLLRANFDLPLVDIMFDDSENARLHDTAIAQPAIYSIQMALVELWRSLGVRPSAVLGHSVGEFAAAATAGLFSLEAGLTLVAQRGRLMQSLPAGGRMVALSQPVDVVTAALAAHDDAVSIAAVNGPDSVVISGTASGVQAVLDALPSPIETHDLVVSHAFHSPQMEAILDDFGAAAAEVEFATPKLPIISNVSGRPAVEGELADPEYWMRHIRQPVQFGPAIAHLTDAGHQVFLEIGPHPTLVGLATRSLGANESTWVGSMRRGRPQQTELARAAATMWTRGVDVDWAVWHAERGAARAVLPTYPMQRERFWIDDVAPWGAIGPASGEVASDGVVLDGLIYDVEWRRWARDSDRLAAPGAFLAPVAVTSERLDSVAQSLADKNRLDEYDEFLPLLDQLCGAYVLDALLRLGLDVDDTAPFSMDTLADRLGVIAQHRQVFARLVEMLTEDGVLAAADASTWTIAGAELPQPSALHSELVERYGRFSAEIDLVSRCGENVAGFLDGTVDPLQVLFPGGSTAEMERIYRDSPMALTFNELVSQAVRSAVVSVPDGRTLRVLEVGAGSGATTESVLPVFTELGISVDYVFTDISASFTVKARQQFADDPRVRFATLDASRPPTEQGFESGSFDLIVAANVIHATPVLATTMANLRSLLAPGGHVVMLEVTTKERLSDLTVGFTPGWWSFEDRDLRPDYALLDRTQWQSLLADVGFEHAAALPDVVGRSALRREAVVVGSVPVDVAPVGAPVVISADWVVVGGGPTAAALTQFLRDAGDRVELVERLGDEVSGTSGVIVVADTATVRADDAPREISELMLSTVQRLLTTQDSPPLWVVTKRAQPIGAERVVDPIAATAWGIAHTVELEHPELRCKRIDLPADLELEVLARLRTELSTPDPDEPQLALTSDGRFVRRLAVRNPVDGASAVLRDDVSYLISGGLRGIGPVVVDWMIERGAKHLVVFGRSAPDAAMRARVGAWNGAGANVHIETADVSQASDVERVVAAARELAPIGGIIHSAGALSDASLLNQDWERFAPVYAAKVDGTRLLLDAVEPAALDHVVLFASGAGVAGSPGQANHAAANAYLDALAHQLHADGVNAVSIDWGAWKGVGAAADLGIDDRPSAFTQQEGLAALDQIIGSAAVQALVRGADWSEEIARFPAGSEPSIYRDVLARERAGRNDRVLDEPTTSSILDRLDGLSSRRRTMVLRTEIRRLGAQVLDITDAEQIEVGQPLHDLGLDSLMAVELRNLIGAAIERELPATLLFEHPSVDALVSHVEAEYVDVADGASDGAPEMAASESGTPSAPPPARVDDGDSASPIGADDAAAALAARLDRLSKDRNG